MILRRLIALTLCLSPTLALAEAWPQPLPEADRAALVSRFGCEGGAMVAGECAPANNATRIDVQTADDLAALPLLPALERVSVDPYLDLAALPGDPWQSLAQLPRLRRLSLSNNPIADLAPLARLQGLQELVVAGTGVTDLAPLLSLPKLRALNLDRTAVTDFTALKKLPALERLVLPDSTILFDRAEVETFLATQE